MSESLESTLNTGRIIKKSFILIRQRDMFLITEWKTFTKKKDIKKIQMTDLKFRVLLVSTFY